MAASTAKMAAALARVKTAEKAHAALKKKQESCVDKMASLQAKAAELELALSDPATSTKEVLPMKRLLAKTTSERSVLREEYVHIRMELADQRKEVSRAQRGVTRTHSSKAAAVKHPQPPRNVKTAYNSLIAFRSFLLFQSDRQLASRPAGSAWRELSEEEKEDYRTRVIPQCEKDIERLLKEGKVVDGPRPVPMRARQPKPPSTMRLTPHAQFVKDNFASTYQALQEKHPDEERRLLVRMVFKELGAQYSVSNMRNPSLVAQQNPASV